MFCINQDDISERQSQVELMGRIFAGASRVLAWLGHDEDGLTSFAMAVIRDILEDPKAALHGARILLHLDDPRDDDRLNEEDRKRFRTEAQRWAAIKAFFDIEYFHRTWIVQELGLARGGHVLFKQKASRCRVEGHGRGTRAPGCRG
jgi:Heterokaryon incompatibility protein (HET)